MCLRGASFWQLPPFPIKIEQQMASPPFDHFSPIVCVSKNVACSTEQQNKRSRKLFLKAVLILDYSLLYLKNGFLATTQNTHLSVCVFDAISFFEFLSWVLYISSFAQFSHQKKKSHFPPIACLFSNSVILCPCPLQKRVSHEGTSIGSL